MKIKKTDLVTIIFFFLLSFCKGCGMTSANKIYILIYCIGLAIGSLKMFFSPINKKEMIFLGSFALIGVADFFIAKEMTILFTAISFFLLKDTSINKIIKSMLIGYLLGFIIMIVLPIIGVIKMNVIDFYRPGIGYVSRNAFGYSHPNFLHENFNIILFLLVYLYYEKMNILKYICLALLSYFMYLISYSRTGFIISVGFIVLSLITSKSDKIKRLLPKMCNIILFISIILSFTFAFLYGKYNIIYKIDDLMTGRIAYMNMMLKNYSIPIIKTNSYGNILFDNGYFDLIYNCGLIATILMLYYQIRTNLFIKKHSMYKESIITCMFLIYAIAESCYASSIVNFSLLFFAFTIFKQVEDEKNEKAT